MKLNRDRGTSNIKFIPEIFDTIIKYLPCEQSAVLDIGCGKGIYGYLLKAYLPKIKLYGIEIDIHSSFKILLQNIYNEIYEKSMEDYIPDKNFDIVFFNHVLEHILLEKVYKIIDFYKEFTTTIIVGLPNSKRNYIYKDMEDPHSHKWGIHNFNFKEVGLRKLKMNYNNIYVWSELSND